MRANHVNCEHDKDLDWEATVQEVLATPNPRLVLVVDESGLAQYTSTLDTEDALRILHGLVALIRGRGTRRLSHHLN